MATTLPTTGLNIDPVLKRFLKVLIGSLIATGLATSVAFLKDNPTALGVTTSLVAAILLAIEKAFPQNF